MTVFITLLFLTGFFITFAEWKATYREGRRVGRTRTYWKPSIGLRVFLVALWGSAWYAFTPGLPW